MEIAQSSWRKELPALLKFAAPISVSQLAALGMGMTDVIVAGNAGTEDLAAVMIGANIWHIVAFTFFGIGLANAPIVGRYFGTRNWSAIRDHMHQSAWLALACGLLTIVFVFLASQFVHRWDIAPEVTEISVAYLLGVLPGAFCMAVVPLFRASLESMDEVHLVMQICVGTFLLNIGLDLWFVFGGLGLEPMGGAGCGLATSVSLMVQIAGLTWYLLRSRRLSELNLLTRFAAPNWITIRSILVLGLPIGLSTLMEIGFFAGMGLRMADIGVLEAGAHAIALNIAAFAFMFFISLGHAVTVRASHAIGRDDLAQARQIVLLGLIFVGLFALCSSLLTFLLRHQLPLLFNQDSEVVGLASQFLIFAALFQFFDGLQAMAICGLRAYKDTAVPSGIQFFAFWIVGLPIGVFLPGVLIGDWLIKGEGVWISFCGALLVSSVMLLIRLFFKVFRQPVAA